MAVKAVLTPMFHYGRQREVLIRRRDATLCWVAAAGVILAGSLALADPSPPAQPRKWALLVGINDYQRDEIPDLRFARNDALQLRETLLKTGGYRPDTVRLMTDQDKGDLYPTSANVQRKLRELATEVGARDTFLFFFSGHGASLLGDHYLLTADADRSTPETLGQTALPLTRVPALLREVRAGSKLFIVDACRNAVSAAKGGQPTLETEGFAKAIEVVSRGGGDSGPSPTVTLCSCSEGETSWEWEAEKQGVFTFFLIDGLEGGAADESGSVTVAGLGKYVEEEVGKWCKEHQDLTSARAQTPWLKVSGSAGTAQLTLAKVRPGAVRRGATGLVAAVLPLHNLTGDPAQDGAGAGLAAALTYYLRYVPKLQLVERLWLNQVLDELRLGEAGLTKRPLTEQDAKQIGELTRADLVFVGEYQRDATLLRVTVRCVDTATAKIISEKSLRQDGDLSKPAGSFALQDQLGRKLLAAFGAPVPEDLKPHDPEAQQWWAEGLRQLYARQYDQAEQSFRKAAELDANYEVAKQSLKFMEWSERSLRAKVYLGQVDQPFARTYDAMKTAVGRTVKRTGEDVNLGRQEGTISGRTKTTLLTYGTDVQVELKGFGDWTGVRIRAKKRNALVDAFSECKGVIRNVLKCFNEEIQRAP